MDTQTIRQNFNPSKKRSRQNQLHKPLKVNYNLPQSATQMEFMIMNFYHADNQSREFTMIVLH